MALGIVNSLKLAHINNDLLTLMQSYKRTPNMFYASSQSASLCRGSIRFFISNGFIRLARTKSQ